MPTGGRIRHDSAPVHNIHLLMEQSHLRQHQHASAGGKSLCFALPAAIMGKLVVVVSPLIGTRSDNKVIWHIYHMGPYYKQHSQVLATHLFLQKYCGRSLATLLRTALIHHLVLYEVLCTVL